MLYSDLLTKIAYFEHPVLDFFMTIISIISHKTFYFLVIPFIYWCVHKQIGFALLYLQVSSMYINEVLKETIMLERPFYSKENGFSFPSGHTQAATTFWGYLIPIVSKRIFTIIAIMMIVIVSFSRLYVGAHWPIDVIGAIFIATFLIYMTLRTFDWIGSMPDFIKLILSIGLPIAFLIFSPENAWYSGFLLGAGIGYLLEQIKNRMEISRHVSKKLLAYFIGMLGVFAIVSMEKMLPNSFIFELLLSGGLGLWITYIAPILFVNLSIYERKGGIQFR